MEPAAAARGRGERDISPSFRDDAQHRTRNLEIPGRRCRLRASRVLAQAIKICVLVLATIFARVLRLPALKSRGRRECRVHAAPAVSRASRAKESAHEHTGEAEAIRHPLREWFDGLYRALLGEPCSVAPVARVMRSIITNLAPASGRRDHATSPYATVPFVSQHLRVHRSPVSRFVTIAMRPSCRGGMRRTIHGFRFLQSRIFVKQETYWPA